MTEKFDQYKIDLKKTLNYNTADNEQDCSNGFVNIKGDQVPIYIIGCCPVSFVRTVINKLRNVFSPTQCAIYIDDHVIVTYCYDVIPTPNQLKKFLIEENHDGFKFVQNNYMRLATYYCINGNTYEFLQFLDNQNDTFNLQTAENCGFFKLKSMFKTYYIQCEIKNNDGINSKAFKKALRIHTNQYIKVMTVYGEIINCFYDIDENTYVHYEHDIKDNTVEKYINDELQLE